MRFYLLAELLRRAELHERSDTRARLGPRCCAYLDGDLGQPLELSAAAIVDVDDVPRAVWLPETRERDDRHGTLPPGKVGVGHRHDPPIAGRKPVRSDDDARPDVTRVVPPAATRSRRTSATPCLPPSAGPSMNTPSVLMTAKPRPTLRSGTLTKADPLASFTKTVRGSVSSSGAPGSCSVIRWGGNRPVRSYRNVRIRVRV
jgi:hypothetical protein